MIAAIGAFFWLLALGALYRILRIGREAGRSRWLEIGLLVVLGILLLFHPHEDIFGGEDPGSYINSSLSYNRQKQFVYVDELLSKVSLETRPIFYYGHSGYGATKDACLWIRNADLAMVGTHFQPAYPLMMATVARLGQESLVLFVVPLFAIFTGLALRALALLTIPHRRAGLIAFLLYILIPLTVWHGRCARPEIIAGFMFFGGLALTLQAWQDRPWKNTLDLLLGAACIGAAPFFHITAWLLVIPAVLAVVIVILAGRDDFLLYLIVAWLALGAFYMQTKYLTDYYTVKRFLDPVMTRPMMVVAAFILLTALSLLVKRGRRSQGNFGTPSSSSVSLLWSLIFAIVLIAFLATIIFFRQIYGDLPVLGRPLKHYLYLTDFRVFANMLSLPVMLIILAGMIVWLTGRDNGRGIRVILVMVLFPAVMLTGNIHDFMMTRYLVMAFVPMAALFMTALISVLLPPQAGLLRVLFLTAILCSIGISKRSHLITTTEHRGLVRFLRPYAEVIKANKGILLCEYSRIAAPLEHFFGVPTLGLDNERQDDYAKAEQAWAEIMRSLPERPAYFATPYHVPVSALFSFEPVFSDTFHDCRLEQARQNLPTKVGKSELPLRLFKMQLRKPQPLARDSTDSVVILDFDAGNMGLRHFANMRSEPLSLPTVELPADTPCELPLPYSLDLNADLLLFFLSDEAVFTPPAITSSVPNEVLNVEFVKLGEKWRLARINGFKNKIPASIIIKPSVNLFLAETCVFSDGHSARFKIKQLPPAAQNRYIKARWARAQAETLLPVPRRRPALLLILLKAPDPEAAGCISLQLIWKGKELGAPREIQSGQWQWQIWQLPPAASGSTDDVGWLGLQTDPAWNPGKPNFPDDLGVLISQIVCLPIQ